MRKFYLAGVSRIVRIYAKITRNLSLHTRVDVSIQQKKSVTTGNWVTKVLFGTRGETRREVLKEGGDTNQFT